jgi:hypothetical protein
MHEFDWCRQALQQHVELLQVFDMSAPDMGRRGKLTYRRFETVEST